MNLYNTPINIQQLFKDFDLFSWGRYSKIDFEPSVEFGNSCLFSLKDINEDSGFFLRIYKRDDKDFNFYYHPMDMNNLKSNSKYIDKQNINLLRAEISSWIGRIKTFQDLANLEDPIFSTHLAYFNSTMDLDNISKTNPFTLEKITKIDNVLRAIEESLSIHNISQNDRAEIEKRSTNLINNISSLSQYVVMTTLADIFARLLKSSYPAFKSVASKMVNNEIVENLSLEALLENEQKKLG